MKHTEFSSVGYTAAMSRYGAVGVGLLMSLIFISGGLIHSLIPHAHSHGIGDGETMIWQELHSALRHEDKTILPVLGVLSIVAALLLIIRGPVSFNTAAIVDSLMDLLRRGVVPHRRFG